MGKTLKVGGLLEAIDGSARPLYKPAIPMGREGGPSATGHGGPSS